MSTNGNNTIYLASKSPRRQELLKQIGINFKILESDIDESQLAAESVEDYVQRLAEDKARTAIEKYKPNDELVVLAADTVVYVNDRVFGKPSNQDQALIMLKQLSNQEHDVYTSIFVLKGKVFYRKTVRSSVLFKKLTNQEMDDYIASGEYRGKAGAYAIQGLAALFISEIRGSYSAVMGLPLYETGELLGRFGLTFGKPSTSVDSRR